MKLNRSRYEHFGDPVFCSLGIGTAVGALIQISLGLAIGAGIGTIFSLIAYYLGKSNGDQKDGSRQLDCVDSLHRSPHAFRE